MNFTAIRHVGLILIAALVAFTIYYSPSAVVARARKRGVYIPRQSFEFSLRKKAFA